MFVTLVHLLWCGFVLGILCVWFRFCFWFCFWFWFGIVYFFFLFYYFLLMFYFHSCFYCLVGTDPEAIVQSVHFALVCFLTLAWVWFCTKLELRFSIYFYSLGTVFPFTFHFHVLMLKDTRRFHWLQRAKTYALSLENMAPEILWTVSRVIVAASFRYTARTAVSGSLWTLGTRAKELCRIL